MGSPALSEPQVARYLAELSVSPTVATPDLRGLAALQHAHLVRFPFENLDIVFAGGVPHDRLQALDKLLGTPDRPSTRGGWCFELNGPFGLLLQALGFDVLLLGAAVLFDGPTKVIEHIALEVSAPGLDPHLVDVGFGNSFEQPIALNDSGVQHGGHADYQLFPSPDGTTLTELVDDVPEARYRFKRVAHDFEDFAPVAAAVQVDPNKHWSTKPFATRLIAPGQSDRVTLTHDRLSIRRDGHTTDTDVSGAAWYDALATWFDITLDTPQR